MLRNAAERFWNALSHIDMDQRWIRWRFALIGWVEDQASVTAKRNEQVRIEFTGNGQQDYPLNIDYNVAAEPRQTIPGGYPSPDIDTNMPGSKSSSLVGWRQPDEPIPGDKSSSTQGWRHPDELVHTNNVELRHVTVPAHIVSQMRTVEQKPVSTHTTGLAEIANNGTESGNAQAIVLEDSDSLVQDEQAIGFEDSSNRVQKVEFEDSTHRVQAIELEDSLYRFQATEFEDSLDRGQAIWFEDSPSRYRELTASIEEFASQYKNYRVHIVSISESVDKYPVSALTSERKHIDNSDAAKKQPGLEGQE
ncbi:uncharacterized protein FOMMEDRAFT_163050 [Fomitiporia mediterranea MF3/22]|uniref:Uncharacterized protein n=1 Tax=Fomitiporia mediterranea (strain MF3/22) TaxID=694068 RepID=R7SFK7_FOMME|nr:uncharacterized protein FOMMEDRAFT_163050 [Fomitiporia mediterranea MF3/22]EJC97511.1 hypothetical protein FOMMEDRAFT_163050 [Fomitiporia mediterranea MF3/22]